MKKFFLYALALGFFSACSGGGVFSDLKGERAADLSGRVPEGGPGEQGQAGVVTAGEWNDLDHWPFWSSLMTLQGDEQTEGYSHMPQYWGFWTGNRVAVLVKNPDGTPAAGVKVSLSDGSTTLWTAVTDALGRADCWAGLHDAGYSTASAQLSLDGVPVGQPEFTRWENEEVKLNEYTVGATGTPVKSADLLFIVDATGSMSDEINFLKKDLADILDRVEKMDLSIAIRTGALFYRDVGDEYLTRHSGFSDDFGVTTSFIAKQRAAGGGDWPEAVHSALESSLQDFSWNAGARTKIAFILLDAPPHRDVKGVMESIHKSIDTYAAMGIKLIPVASSGIDKSTEFLLRMFAIATGGTYVFLTNDSGVGLDHIEATVGDYEVELLNDLMVRLIRKYLGL